MFGKALSIYANEFNDAVPRGIWQVERTGGDDVAREFYWEVFWDYLNLPSATTYQEKLNYASDAGVLHCPAYRLPDNEGSSEWKKARSYAVNEQFQPEPRLDRFNRPIYPYPLAKMGFVRRPGETCYMADTTGDSQLTRKDLALMFSPPPFGERTDPAFNPRHRDGKAANVLFMDTHVSSMSVGDLPPFDTPEAEAEYYDAHAFWNGQRSLTLDDE